MNYKKLGQILGKILILESILMLAPLLVSIVYKESLTHKLAFLLPIAAAFAAGMLLQLPRVKSSRLGLLEIPSTLPVILSRSPPIRQSARYGKM